ncbi:MAG: hypothetical protein AB7V46_19005, partial [Thermomicrobiales bacterium]
MASPKQQTVAYCENPPPGSQPERVRVALVGGSGASQADELYPLLRRRLLVLSLFLAGSIAVTVVILFAQGPSPDIPYAATYLDILTYSLRFLVSIAIHLT